MAEDAITDYPLNVVTGNDPSAPALRLRLRRLGKPNHRDQRAVLLLHGANSSSETFLVPNGGLASDLKQNGWDVWLLDWRGSPFVMEPLMNEKGRSPLGGSPEAECELFSFDTVAREDLPRALQMVRDEIGKTSPLSVLGHCVAGGVVSIGIALGMLEPFNVTNVVLVALGLFYEVPWDGWVKVEDFILERVQTEQPSCLGINPRTPGRWPSILTTAYERWPSAWRVPRETARPSVRSSSSLSAFASTSTSTFGSDELLRRLSFMVGKPWDPERIHPGLTGEPLERIFGPLHLGLFLHSGQMVRRGYAAPFGAPDVLDRPRIPVRARQPLPPSNRASRDPLTPHFFLPEYFKKKRITLIGGAENRVWHRNCLDLMYEWLRGVGGDLGVGQYAKHILLGYNLQELFWHPSAVEDVYPLLRDGLARR